jgi:hypothetical protein
MMTVGQALTALLSCPLWIAGSGVAIVGLFPARVRGAGDSVE